MVSFDPETKCSLECKRSWSKCVVFFIWTVMNRHTYHFRARPIGWQHNLGNLRRAPRCPPPPLNQSPSDTKSKRGSGRTGHTMTRGYHPAQCGWVDDPAFPAARQNRSWCRTTILLAVLSAAGWMTPPAPRPGSLPRGPMQTRPRHGDACLPRCPAVATPPAHRCYRVQADRSVTVCKTATIV